MASLFFEEKLKNVKGLIFLIFPQKKETSIKNVSHSPIKIFYSGGAITPVA